MTTTFEDSTDTVEGAIHDWFSLQGYYVGWETGWTYTPMSRDAKVFGIYGKLAGWRSLFEPRRFFAKVSVVAQPFVLEVYGRDVVARLRSTAEALSLKFETPVHVVLACDEPRYQFDGD